MGTNIFEKQETGEYRIVGYIKSDDEIDLDTFKKIKARYPDEPNSGLSLELKMLRLGISDPKDEEFVTYNDFVNTLRLEGRKKKEEAKQLIATLIEVELTDSMGVKILVRK
jgi:hypothetical protein